MNEKRPSLDYHVISSQNKTIKTLANLPKKCSDKVVCLVCSHCGYLYYANIGCGHRSCPFCNRKWAFKLVTRYSPAVALMQSPKLVTLTLRTTPKRLRAEVIRIRKAWRNLIRRKPFDVSFRGGIYRIECKNIGNGWNIHLHCLVDSVYVSQKQISDAWRSITGDSFIVDIRKVNNIFGVRYVLKDMSKVDRLISPEYRAEYDKAMKGLHLVDTFGSLYGSKVPVLHYACPDCSSYAWVSAYDSLFEDALEFSQSNGFG